MKTVNQLLPIAKGLPMSMMIHCGGSEVTREQVVAAHTPDPTETHIPVAHAYILNLLDKCFQERDLTIASESHALHGDRYFGLFEVQANNGQWATMIGCRNSHDKKFPAALALGSRVFVCDNLAFSADVKIQRRHTKNILRHLAAVFAKGFGRLMQHQVNQDLRLTAYQEQELSHALAESLMIKALRSGAINKGRIERVIKEWDAPSHPEFAEGFTVWRLYNAFTEALKPRDNKAIGTSHLARLGEATTQLHGILDHACPNLTLEVVEGSIVED